MVAVTQVRTNLAAAVGCSKILIDSAAAGGEEILPIHEARLRIEAGERPIHEARLRIEAGGDRTLILNTQLLTVLYDLSISFFQL